MPEVARDDEVRVRCYRSGENMPILRVVRHRIDQRLVTAGHCLGEMPSHRSEQMERALLGDAEVQHEIAMNLFEDLVTPVEAIQTGVRGAEQRVPERRRYQYAGIQHDLESGYWDVERLSVGVRRRIAGCRAAPRSLHYRASFRSGGCSSYSPSSWLTRVKSSRPCLRVRSRFRLYVTRSAKRTRRCVPVFV